MRAQLRSRLLMAALALSLAATAWVAGRDEDVEAATAAGAQATRPARLQASSPMGWPAALPAANLGNGGGEGPAWPEPEAIARQAWGLAASVEQQAADESKAQADAPQRASAARERAEAAAPPPAPPFAYQLVGRMDEAGRPRIVLSNAQRTLVLGVGELVEQQWRIDAIGPAGASLSWLAGGQKQNLAYSNP